MLLSSERLVMRPAIPDDLPALYRIYGDPATNTFNPGGPLVSPEQASVLLDNWQSHWHLHGFGILAISLKSAPDNVAGFGGLSLREAGGKKLNNLGYRLATEAWGKGLATEFAQIMVRYAFESWDLCRVDAIVRQNHLASQRVLEKAGLSVNGHVFDVPDAPASLTFTLSAAVWRARQATPQ